MDFQINGVPVSVLAPLSGSLGQELKNFKKDSSLIPNNLIKEIQYWCSTRNFDKIIWVPSNKFSHTMPWFAEKIAGICNAESINMIYFTRKIKEQKHIESYEERKENVQSAFKLEGDIGGKILLIDDVYASGTTIKEILPLFKDSADIEVLVFVYRDH